MFLPMLCVVIQVTSCLFVIKIFIFFIADTMPRGDTGAEPSLSCKSI